ncbi:hypothetical protein ACFC0M_23840 [Streptomyces sp. NPDC056149]|uniref:DUF6891 domain-containing protein n=1 Tax=Streptomyces sp. NPDC056149 TaxID=3345728 RepID=UPI0035DE6CE9
MLAITVTTASGPGACRPAADELTAPPRRIGAADDRLVTAERVPAADHAFLQSWREGDGPFAVEYRAPRALGEISGERAAGDQGFVFFSHHGAEAAAEGHGLSVRYGAYADYRADRAETGRTVAAELAGAGPSVEGDGDSAEVIEISPAALAQAAALRGVRRRGGRPGEGGVRRGTTRRERDEQSG